jgi:hypothetical protein
MFLEGAARMDRTEQMIRELVETQKRAEARLAQHDTKFERLIAALLGRGPNGRDRR